MNKVGESLPLFHTKLTSDPILRCIFPPANLFLGEREVVAIPKCFLEVEGRPTAAQPALLQEGDAVAQHFGLVQVMCREDDCSGLKTQSGTTRDEK